MSFFKNTRSLLSPQFFLLIIFIIALLCRVYAINDFDLWFDELGSNIFTYQYLTALAEITQEPVKDLFIHNLMNDPNSSLYYLLIHAFSFLFGNEYSLRLFSLFCSLLSLGIFYKLSNEFFSKKKSLIATMLLTLNAFHLWYAQEARVYALLGFVSLCAVYLFVKCIRENKWIYWISFSFTSLASLLLSYHYISILIVSFFTLFLFKNPYGQGKNSNMLIRWIICMGFIGLGFLFFSAPFLSGQLSYVKDSFWLKPPTLQTAFQTIKVFNFGYVPLTVVHWMGLAVMLFLFAFGLLESFSKKQKETIFIVLCLLFPIIFTYIVSKVFTPIYINRQLFFAVPYYYLFVSYGIDSINQKWIRRGLTLFIFMVLFFSVMQTYSGKVIYNDFYRLDGVFAKKKYQNLLGDFKKDFHPGDYVVATDMYSLNLILSEMIKNNNLKNYDVKNHFRFFFKPDLIDPTEQRYVGVTDKIQSLSIEKRSQLYSIDYLYNQKNSFEEVQISHFPFNRVWIISASFGPHDPIVWNAKVVVDAFKTDYVEVYSKQQDGISFKLFVRSPAT